MIRYCYQKANEFCMKPKNKGQKIIISKGNSIVRNNLFDISFADGSAYFGYLNGE